MVHVPGTQISVYDFVLPGGGAPAPDASDRMLLAPEEMERAARFRQTNDQDNFIACRSALRRILAEPLGMAPGDVPILAGPHGKPSTPGIAFNVSHTKTHAVIALTLDPSITYLGIDIERSNPGFPHLQAARRHFPQEEVSLLESTAPPDVATVFNRLWTAREASLKAVGTGLAWDLDRVAINLETCTATTADLTLDLHFLNAPGVPGDHLSTVAFA